MDAWFANQDGLIYLALALGLFLAWAIGANDLSNSVGAAVGAKVLRIREAVFVAAVFELAGALFYGTHVTETFTRGIVHLDAAMLGPDVVVPGVLAAMLAAGLWLSYASARGWPVSATHSIIGALVGFAVTAAGWGAVHPEELRRIVSSWVLSPLLGGALAFVLMFSIRILILNAADPVRSAHRWTPLYVFLAAFVVCLVTFYGGMRPLGIQLTREQILLLSVFFGLGMMVMGMLLVRQRDREHIEDAFAPMTIFTVCSMAFAHGSNDVANSVGPLALLVDLLRSTALPTEPTGPTLWLYLLGGLGMVAGLVTFGYRVVNTIGLGITPLSPCRAFSVALAATATVLLASRSGLPVSTTHTVVGAVLGVGLAGGKGLIQYSAVKVIVASWLVTLPLTVLLGAGLFLLFRAWLGI